MRFIGTLFIFLLVYFVQGQNYEELLVEYQKGEFEYVIEKGVPLITKNYYDIDLQLLVGRAYADNLQYEEALPYLKYVDQNAKKNGWRRGWGNVYLGICNFGIGKYEWSRTYLNKAASDGDTDNIRSFAKEQLIFLGFDKEFQDFRLKVDEGILFHFHPDIADDFSQLESFISDQKAAFLAAKTFFECNVPKEVDIFVWNSREEMEEVLSFSKNDFVKPELCVVHVPVDETDGKEFSLVVSYYLDRIKKQSAIISFGTALYLANPQKNMMSDAQEVIKAKNISNVSVNDIWVVNRTDSELYNTVSAAFVQYLIEEQGKEKFLELFKEQTYYNAKKVYGKKFDSLIKVFEDKLL